MTDSWAVPKTATLLMTGSSLTSGRLNGRLAESLQERLIQQPEARGRVQVISAGRGSQTSTWGVENIGRLAALRADFYVVEPWDINNAVVTGGTPAVSRSQATTDRAAVRAAIKAQRPDAEIIWWTGNPVDTAGQSLRPDLALYYADTVAQAAAWGDTCVDAYGGTSEFPGGWPKPLPASLTYDNDGLHPTPTAVETYILPQLILAMRRKLATFYGLSQPSTPTFSTLTLSANTIAENSAPGTVVGAIQGLLPGRTPVLTNDAGGRFAIASNGSGGFNLVAGVTGTDYETEVATNRVLRTENFAGAEWNKASGSSVVSDAALAPNGTQTADRVTLTTANGSNVGQNIGSLASGSQRTASVWLRTETGTATVGLYLLDGNGWTGVTENVVTLTTIWQRFSVSRTSAVTGSHFIVIGNRNVANTSGAVQILAWGAQVNDGALKGYVPRDTAGATAANHQVTIRQVGGDVVNSPRDTTLTVSVTDVAVETVFMEVLIVGGGQRGFNGRPIFDLETGEEIGLLEGYNGGGGAVQYRASIAAPAVGSWPVVVAGANEGGSDSSSFLGISAATGGTPGTNGANAGFYDITGSNLGYGQAGAGAGLARGRGGINDGSYDGAQGGGEAGTVIVKYAEGAMSVTGGDKTTSGGFTRHVFPAGNSNFVRSS
jgi:hypothetical protein